MMRRRRFSRGRKFRRRWDMQTFRDCDRSMDLAIDQLVPSCSAPQIFADYLCGIGPSTSPQMKPGASRTLTYGGGHLHVEYHVAQVSGQNFPCSFAFQVVTAIVKLPLLEDDLTPAYLPNVMVSRSQLSVVPSTESDTDEDVLYWTSDQLFALNIDCSVGGNNCARVIVGTGCSNSGDNIGANALAFIEYGTTVLHGRSVFDHQVKTKRRLKEREALFLLTEYRWGTVGSADNAWPVRRTVYHRYAVR